MKKIALLLILICMLFCGCETENEAVTRFSNARFMPVQGEQDLYYDVDTKTVYVIMIDSFGAYDGTGYMSPYYADNGLPYLYNTETNSLEENSWTKFSGLENWLNH